MIGIPEFKNSTRLVSDSNTIKPPIFSFDSVSMVFKIHLIVVVDVNSWSSANGDISRLFPARSNSRLNSG